MKSPIQTEDTRFLELLQKWLSGDFTRSDEMEMNTLAGGDDFRREAMDGLLEHPEYDHAKVLSSLQDRLHAKRKSRRIGLPQIMAMAAAVVLLIGAIWFFNVRPVPEDQGKLALERPDTILPEAKEEAPALESQNSTPALKKNSATQPAYAPSLKKDVAASTKPPDNIGASADLADQPNTYQDAEVAVDDVNKSERYQQSGTIAEQSTNIARANERAKEAKSALKKSSAPAPARSNAEEKADSGQYSKTEFSTTAPVNGWDNFRLYLNNKARLTPSALANNVTGTVRLQFKIDSKNQPFDFIVVQKLGFGCDEAAIQLIKDASWVRGNGLPVIVDVPFVR